jgi:N-methylhydantoinase A
VYAYTDIMPGFQLTGPAIVTQDLTTLVIEPDHHARMDAYGNIVMSIPHPHVS